MRSTFLLFMLLSSICSLTAQNLIAVAHNGQSSFFTDLQPALDAAVDGDTVYLPGGGFSQVFISKSIHLIGTGYYPDSTTATGATIIQYIEIKAGASNGSINGLSVGTIVIGVSSNGIGEIADFEISRCYFLNGIVDASFDPGTTANAVPIKRLLIRENIIGAPIGSGLSAYFINDEAILISNNIILGLLHTFDSDINNNVFLATGSSLSSGNSTIKNNIFKNSSVPCIIDNSFLYNNLNNGTNGIDITCGNQGSGNYLNTPPTFVNFSGSGFSFTDDFHLTTNYLGTDGTPVGIYGGLYPWKAGGVPYNPHIQTKTIAPTTNAQGSLNVQIRVAAQDH